MRTIRFIISIMFLMGLVLATPSVINVESSVSPDPLLPGMSGVLTLAVSNGGLTDVTHASVKVESIGTPLTVDDYDWIEIGGVDAGSSNNYVLKINVPSATKSGRYTVKMNVRYCDLTGCDSVYEYVYLKVQEPTTVSLSSFSPTVLVRGFNSTLKAVFKNNGREAVTSLMLAWKTSDSSILPLGADNTINIQSIDGGKTGEVEIPVIVTPSAQLGSTAIIVTGTYYDQTGTGQTVTSTTSVKISDPYVGDVLEIIDIAPMDASIGAQFEFKMKLKNMVGADIGPITLTITSDGALMPLGSGNKLYIERVGGNNEKDLSMQFGVSQLATIGLHPITIDMDYYDHLSSKRTVRYSTSMFVGGQTEFDVTMQDVTKNQFSFSIANIGTNPAAAVAVKILPGKYSSVKSAVDSFIGTLAPSEYTTVSFDLMTLIPGSEDVVTLQISYTDTFGKRHSEQYQVPVKFESVSKQISTAWTDNIFLIIGAVLVLLALAVFGAIKIKNHVKKK